MVTLEEDQRMNKEKPNELQSQVNKNIPNCYSKIFQDSIIISWCILGGFLSYHLPNIKVLWGANSLVLRFLLKSNRVIGYWITWKTTLRFICKDKKEHPILLIVCCQYISEIRIKWTEHSWKSSNNFLN